MFALQVTGLRHDEQLQIVQADVRLSVDGETVVDEAMCVDVGLPALLLSALHDTNPNRWAPATAWERMPFFICGCGDPECRAVSLVVRHLPGDRVRLIEVEERESGEPRRLAEYDVPLADYRREVTAFGRVFLKYVSERDYRPYFADTLSVVRELMSKLEDQAQESSH